MRIIAAEEFERRYRKLPLAIQRKAEKQAKFFQQNPFHPSLHTEKLEPKGKQVWSFRIDQNYRIVFRFISGDTALFLSVGSHDWIYRLKF